MSRAKSRSFELAAPALVALAPLLLGGAPAWSVVAIAGLAVTALVIAVRRTKLSWARADAAAWCGLLWTAAQCIPLPWGVSSTHREVMRSYELAGIEAAWTAISLDPGATREKVVVGVALVASYFVGRLVAIRKGSRAVFGWSVASVGGVVAVALGHEVVGADKLYGWHSPRFITPTLLGPVLNPNHLGAFAAFGSTCFWALALERRARPVRVGFAVAGAVCAAVAVAALSRGAILSLLLGTGWLVVLLATRRRRTTVDLGRWLAVGGVALLAVGLITYVGLEGITNEFRQSDWSKLDLIRESSQLAFVQPLFGIGRGAFEPVFAGVVTGDLRFTHPENVVAQWVVEWGFVVPLIVVSSLGPAVLRALRSDRFAIAGVAGGLAAFFVHDLFDFALELPGVASVASMTLGALVTSQTRTRRPSEEPRSAFDSRLVWGAVGGLAVATLALGAGVITQRADSMVEEIRQASSSERPRIVAEAVRLHPLDPRVPLFVGHALRTEDPAGALRWLNRSMELAPSWAAPHVSAAWVLWSRGARDQALIELREAEARRRGAAGQLLCPITRAMDAERVWRHLEGASAELRASLAPRIAACLRDEQRVKLDALVVDEFGPRSESAIRLAQAHSRAGRTAEAIQLLERVLEDDPASTSAKLALARVLRSSAGPAAALEVLPPGPASWAEHVLRAELAAELGDEDRLERELGRLRALAAGNSTKLADAWSIAGRIEESRGNLGAATQAFERAARLDPDSLSHLRSVARIAERTGQALRAQTARRELCRRGDESSCPHPETP